MIDQYINIAQQTVLDINAKTMVVVGGRGIGKGLIQASWIRRNMERMAASCGGIVAPNTKRALTNTIPSMLIHWENWGIKRNRDYCIGIRPPKKWNWPKPLFVPENWENVISLKNGSIAYIISQDRKGTSNSLSLDWLSIDEAKYINYEQLKDETFPANRGNASHFGSHYYHHGMLVTSDMPSSKKGSWFMNYREQCQPDIVNMIKSLVVEEYDLRQAAKKRGRWTDRARARVMEIATHLAQLRYLCTYYVEFPSLFNIDILGEDWVRQMKRDLPPLTFRTSIMCQRIGVAQDGFYSNLREEVNFYTSVNEKYLKGLNYDVKKLMNTNCLADGDVDLDRQLCIAFDFNGNINWMVVGQDGYPKAETRVLKSFWVKYDRKLPELLDDFMEYYQPMRLKRVVFYYDQTATRNNYALHNDDFHEFITNYLSDHGWEVVEVYLGNPAPHLEKMLLINRMFVGRARTRILINQENNEDLILCLEDAGIYDGGKDKRGEKLPETEEDPLQHRTDGSDAFDTLVLGMEKHPQDDGFVIV